MLAVKQELCTFCGNEGFASGVGIDDDGHIFFHLDHRILSKSGAGGAHILVCPECLKTDDIEDRIKTAVERRDAQQLEGGDAAKSEEPRNYWGRSGPCVLCEGEDAMGYRIDEEGIVPAFMAEVETDCFLCQECRERDDFEDRLGAYFERRGIYADWL